MPLNVILLNLLQCSHMEFHKLQPSLTFKDGWSFSNSITGETTTDVVIPVKHSEATHATAVWKKEITWYWHHFCGGDSSEGRDTASQTHHSLASTFSSTLAPLDLHVRVSQRHHGPAVSICLTPSQCCPFSLHGSLWRAETHTHT